MFDFMMLGLTIAGFAAATAYARFCDELARPATNIGDEER
jgi:hypothetical protein